MQNLSKWVHLSFLALGALCALVLRELLQLLLTRFALQPVGGMFSWSDVGALTIGFIIFIALVRSAKAKEFFADVLSELAKVAWPVRKETALSTGMVAIVITIATLFLLLFDSVWRWMADKFLY